MPGPSTVLKLIRRMDTKKMRQTAHKVAADSGRPFPLVFCDMVWCGFRYEAGYSDYALFHMWNMNAHQRSTVLTRGKNDRYVRALNQKEGLHLFGDKAAFLTAFSPFINRRWLDLTCATPQQLAEMAEGLDEIIVKPQDASHGDGVEKIAVPQGTHWQTLHTTLLKSGQTLCEEVIAQHPAMNALWPGSINTIRLVTILKDGKGHVVAAYLRVGNGPRPVDNFNNGGMVVPLDQHTGIVRCHAMDKAGAVYEAHPATGVTFPGFAVPMWEEALLLARTAATVVPSVRYVGWDIAITPNGPVLVEGNQFPGHDIYGLPAQTPDKIGILPALEAVIPLASLSDCL